MPEYGDMEWIFRFFIFPFAVFALCAGCGIKAETEGGKLPLRVASYNMAFCRNSNDLKIWDARKDYIMQVLRDEKIDICAAQEPYAFQMKYLAARAPEYAFAETPTGDETPEKFAARTPNFQDRNLILPNMNNPVWYRRDKFELLNLGRFYFSPTPEKMSGCWLSDRWDKIRHCTWAEFSDKKTSKRFFVFNVHFVVSQNDADKEALFSARLLLEKIGKIAGETPFFVMGDFNATEAADCIKLLLASPEMKSARRAAGKIPAMQKTSFIGFDPAKKSAYKEIIDHIFVSNSVRVKTFSILRPQYKNAAGEVIDPSDHLPLVIDAEL